MTKASKDIKNMALLEKVIGFVCCINVTVLTWLCSMEFKNSINIAKLQQDVSYLKESNKYSEVQNGNSIKLH